METIYRSPVAVVIPTYNETETLSVFLKGLSSHMSSYDLIVIADDSDPRFRDEFITMCQTSIENQKVKIMFTFSDSKSGRGLAIRRAMELIQNLDCEIEYVIEWGENAKISIFQALNNLFCDLCDSSMLSVVKMRLCF